MNVLLFHGERVVSPDDLESTKDRSQYKADGRIHEQERDVSKFLKKDHTTVVMAGFEHQTAAEKYMPLRVGNYDFQSYRSQLLNRKVRRIYPVVTLVLYFGMKHWPYSRHLTDLIDIPDKYRPFISDYEMRNLYEIALLTPDDVKMFRSDFRYVADYFVQMRMTNNYKPDPDVIEHVDATLKLMSVLTGDYRFEEVIPELPKGGATMCAVLDQVENRGIEKGINRGKLLMLVDLVQKGKLTIEEAYPESGMTKDKFRELLAESKND